MIKIVIIEDEHASRSKLKRFIDRLQDEIQLLAELETVHEVQDFFKIDREVDLIISDIELRDGNVFSFLEQATIHCPIIFITAYNQFWTNAFESMGIEYLLKPYNFNRFEKAWNKFKKIGNPSQSSSKILNQLESLLKLHNDSKGSHRERFAYKRGSGTAFIQVQDISVICAEQGAVFIFNSSGERLLSAENGLQHIYDQLNKDDFFMINRGEIVHKKYVERIERFSKNIISVKMLGLDQRLKTSQSRTSDFSEWVKR